MSKKKVVFASATMKQYESYRAKNKEPVIALIIFYGVLLELVMWINYIEDFGFDGAFFTACVALQVIAIVLIGMYFKRQKKATVEFNPHEIHVKGLLTENIISYDDVKNAIETNGLELHLNKVSVKVNRTRLNFYFDIGGKKEDRDAYEHCYQYCGERCGLDVKKVAPASLTTLDEKYFYTRRMRNKRIVMFCSLLFSMGAMFVEEEISFFLGILGWIIAAIAALTYFRDYFEAKSCDPKIDTIVEEHPYFKRKICRTNWLSIVPLPVMAIVFNLPLIIIHLLSL